MAKQKLTYSRHARNRMKLYGITDEDIEKAIAKPDKGPVTEANRYVVFAPREASLGGCR